MKGEKVKRSTYLFGLSATAFTIWPTNSPTFAGVENILELTPSSIWIVTRAVSTSTLKISTKYRYILNENGSMSPRPIGRESKQGKNVEASEPFAILHIDQNLISVYMNKLFWFIIQHLSELHHMLGIVNSYTMSMHFYTLKLWCGANLLQICLACFSWNFHWGLSWHHLYGDQSWNKEKNFL